MRSVIVHTDPGADDPLALMMAMNSSDLLVEGITTVGGNATLQETTDNTLRLVEHLDGRQSAMPVALGADRPAHGTFTHAYHVHGSEGLGIRLPAPTLTPHGTDAAEFIRHRVSTSLRPITLLAIGPLTNVAVALDNRPDMVNAFSEIIVAGGAVGVPGNITPHAEFNIHQDPRAANAVFAPGVPVTLAGLDVTRRTFMHRRDGPQWFEGTSKSARLANCMLAGRLRELDDGQEFHLHDPVAVAATIAPDVLTCRWARVSVVTDGNELGRTTATYGGGPVRVADGIDLERALEIVRSAISL